MTTFYRYPLPIKAALVDYRRRFNCYPNIITVNRARLTEAQDLGLKPVTSGGCLASEVWLSEPPNDNGKTIATSDNKQNNGGAAPVKLALI